MVLATERANMPTAEDKPEHRSDWVEVTEATMWFINGAWCLAEMSVTLQKKG